MYQPAGTPSVWKLASIWCLVQDNLVETQLVVLTDNLGNAVDLSNLKAQMSCCTTL